MGRLDLCGQGLVGQPSALVFGLLGTQLGAALFLAGQALLQLRQEVFQVFGRRRGLYQRGMLAQACIAFLEQHSCLFDSLVGCLHGLAYLLQVRVVHDQQALERSVVELGMVGSPAGDSVLQLPIFLLQGGVTRLFGLELAAERYQLFAGLLQLLDGRGLVVAGLLQLLLQLTLPVIGAGVPVEQVGQALVELPALRIQVVQLAGKLQLMLPACLQLVVQACQMLLALLSLLLVLLLLRLLSQAQGDLLVEFQEGLRRLLAQALQARFGEQLGEGRQGLLEVLRVGCQCLLLLVQALSGLLLRLAGRLQLLVETSRLLLHVEQLRLASLVTTDLVVEPALLGF